MSEAAAPSAPAESTGAAEPQATEQAPPKVETPPSPLTWDPIVGDWVAKTKVDGKEAVTKWTDLHKNAQQAQSAQERYEKAKAIARENAELRERSRMHEELAVNPRKAMQAWAERGYDPRQVLAVLQSDIEAEARLTPAERELRDSKAKLAQYEQAERQRVEQERARAEEQAENAEHERMEKAFHRHMDKLNLPPGSELRGLMSTLMWAMHDDITTNGGEPVPLAEATQQAFGVIKSMAREVLGMLPPDERLALIGADAVTKAQQAALAGAAPIAKSVASERAQNMPRERDGKFSKFTTFSNFRSFSEAADRAEGRRRE